MKLNKQTKSFGFIFDNLRKVGNTLPLTKEEYLEFVLGGLLRWVNYDVLQRAKSEIGSAERDFHIANSDKLGRRLIHIYGEEASDALSTISYNLLSKKLKLTTFDYPTLTYHLVKDTKKFKKLIESIYEDIKSRPLNELTRSIGVGISGMALPDSGLFKDKNVIIKKFPGGVPPISKEFYNYCKNNDTQCLVKVYEVGNDYVKMQKLKVGSLKCVKFIDEVNQIIQYQYQNKGKVPRFAKLGTLAWINEVSKMCEYVHVPLYRLDLHEGNVGENDKGDIILFDPIGPDLDQKADTSRLNKYAKMVERWGRKFKH